MELGNAALWSVEKETPLNTASVPFEVARADLLTLAAAIDELTGENNFGEVGQFRALPDLPDPFLEAVIEIGLAQDSVLDAGLRRSGLKDDSISAIWQRLIIIPMEENAQTPTAYRAKTYECHRGSQFPPEGGLRP